MESALPQSILGVTTEHYLSSRDFNGQYLPALAKKLSMQPKDFNFSLVQLIEQQRVGLLWPDVAINMHINRLGFPAVQEQIDFVRTSLDSVAKACIYPTTQHLESVVNRNQFAGQPFTLELALGLPQLDFRTFDLQVLETYRNDPRYHFECNDVSGLISIRNEYFETGTMPESDQILLETFGFAFDENLNRYVASFLRYLANLSQEHQAIWKAREIKGHLELHPDYFRTSILGDWPERQSIFEAFCVELYLVNQMSRAMRRPTLFRKDFGQYGEARPKKFSFLLRPTLEELNSFAHLLDKLLSDNLSKKFFLNEVSLNQEIVHPDGRIEIRQRGTIQLLDDWIRTYFQTDDWDVWTIALNNIREVREARQRPAHEVNEDRFDVTMHKQQRELMKKGYNAVRSIRLILENHPLVRDAQIEVPDWVRFGKIWTF